MATVRNPFDEDDDVSITMLDPDEEPSPESDDNGANANADRKARSNDNAERAINPFTAVDEDEGNEADDEDIPIVIPGADDGKDSDTDNDSSDENPSVDEVIDSDDGDEVTIVMPEEDEEEDDSVSVDEEGESASSSPATNNDNHSSIKVTSKFNKRQSSVNDNDSSVGKNEPDKSRHDDRTDSHHRENSTDNHDESVSSDSQQVKNRPSFNPFVDADDNEDDNVEIDLPDEDMESSNDSVKADDETAANVEDSSGLDHNDDVKNSGDESTDSMVSSGSDDNGVAVGSSDEDVVGPSAGESSSKNDASDEESSDEGGTNDEDSFIEGKDDNKESSDDSDDVDVVMIEPEPLVEDSDDSESDDGNGSESEDEFVSDDETGGANKVGKAGDDDGKELAGKVSHVEDDDKDQAGHDDTNDSEADIGNGPGANDDGEDHSAVSEEPVASASDDESESDVDDSDESNDGHDNGRGSSVGRSVPSDENVPDSKVMDSGESVDSGPDSQSTDNDDVDSDTASGVGEPSSDHDSEDDTVDENTVTDNDGIEDTVGPVEDVPVDDENKTSLSESDDGSESDSSDDVTVTVDDDEESSSDDGEDLIQSWDDENAGLDESDDVDPHDEDASENGVDEDEESDENDSQEEAAVSGEDGSGSEDGPGGDSDHEGSSGQGPDGPHEEDVDDGGTAESDDDEDDVELDSADDDGVVFPIGDEGDWTDEEPDEYDEVVENEESDDEDDDDTVAEDDDESNSEDEDDDTADEDDGGPDSGVEDGTPGEDDDLVGLFHEPADFSEDEDADDDEEPVDSDLEALFADKDSVAMLKGGHHRKSGRTQSKGRTSGSSRKPKNGDRNKNRGHHDSPDDGSGDDVDHHRGGSSTRSGPRNDHLHDQERGPGRIDLAEVAGDGDEVADEATRRFDEASAAGRWGSHGLATGTAIGGAVHSLGSFGRIHNHKAIEDPEKARALTVREWRMGHGVRFTARDVAALDYLTRWSYATTAQVARAGGWRDRKESRLMRRFETWEDMGWAHADREFAGPVLWTPTNAGSSFGPHAWLGGVNYHRVNPVSQSHSLGLSSLASWLLSGWGDDVLHLGDDWPVLKAELSDGRAYLVSEREVRSGYTKIRSLVRGLVPIRYRCAMLGGVDPMGREPQPSRFKAFSEDYSSGKAGLEDSPEFLACDPEELGREQWLWVVWGDWVWNRDPSTGSQSYVPVEDRYDVNTNRPLMRKSMGDVFTLLDHVPDMVIARLRNEDGSSRSLAIELELKDKGVFAYERTMASYGSRLGRLLYDRVLWVVPNSTVALSLYRAANNVGMVRGEDYEIIPFYTVERRNSYWTGADIVPAVWGRNNRVIPTIDPNSFLLS